MNRVQEGPDAATDGARGTAQWGAPAVGAIRRVQALRALGHSWPAINSTAGMATHGVLYRSQARVHARMDAGVRRAYNALSARAGTTPSAARIRMESATAGFAPPLAWDEPDDLGHVDWPLALIDDPTASPHPCFRSSRRHGIDWLACIEDVEDMAKAGEGALRSAARSGVAWETLERRLSEYGRQGLLARLVTNSPAKLHPSQQASPRAA